MDKRGEEMKRTSVSHRLRLIDTPESLEFIQCVGAHELNLLSPAQFRQLIHDTVEC